MKRSETNACLEIQEVKSRMIVLRGQPVLLDRDVAALYGVETKALNQAVKRNIERFPEGYILTMTPDECLRSQLVTLNGGRGSNIKYMPHVFTERGLYMLATILRGERAVNTSLAIVETYAQVCAMVREMETLQPLKDGSPEQAEQLSQAGHRLASIEPIAKLPSNRLHGAARWPHRSSSAWRTTSCSRSSPSLAAFWRLGGCFAIIP